MSIKVNHVQAEPDLQMWILQICCIWEIQARSRLTAKIPVPFRAAIVKHSPPVPCSITFNSLYPTPWMTTWPRPNPIPSPLNSYPSFSRCQRFPTSRMIFHISVSRWYFAHFPTSQMPLSPSCHSCRGHSFSSCHCHHYSRWRNLLSLPMGWEKSWKHSLLFRGIEVRKEKKKKEHSSGYWNCL